MNARAFAVILVLCLTGCVASTQFPVDKRYAGGAPYGDGLHPGIDYAIPTGTPVIAVSRGRVVHVRPAPDGIENGREVILVHGKHFLSVYAHLSKTCVEKDQWVDRGQLLGLSGASNNYGRRDHQHLHFGLSKIGIQGKKHSDSFDPALFWISGQPQCFDPKASYSAYTNKDISGPIACGDHAEALKAQCQDRP